MFTGSTNGARTAEPGEHGNTHTLSSVNKYRHSYCATMCDVMTCVWCRILQAVEQVDSSQEVSRHFDVNKAYFNEIKC